MKIVADRLEYTELMAKDMYEISKIATNMVWKDTVDILFREDIKEELNKSKPELCAYRQCLQKAAESILKKPVSQFTEENKQDLYKKLNPDLIPQEYWHINFSQLKPPFIKSVQNFIIDAKTRAEQNPRTGFWFAIRDKETHKIIGVTTISSKQLNKDAKIAIGHSGQFIDPVYQRKGYISETKATMVDFLYKYNQIMGTPIPENAEFYTTCDKFNVASQALQRKSGAKTDSMVDKNGKLHYWATKEDLYKSDLMQKATLMWSAELDNGKKILSDNLQKQISSVYSYTL